MAWYRGGEAGSQRNASAAAAALLQVLGAGGIRGPLRPSAYWQLYQFEDQDAQRCATPALCAAQLVQGWLPRSVVCL